MCATGLFLNQWVYVPELYHYELLTEGLIKIIPESIKCGYLFESKNIFANYIKDLFEMKNSVSKNDPWYLIAKILMNALYGRFGLRQELTEFIIMNDVEIEAFIKDKTINDIIKLEDSDKSVVVLLKKDEELHLESSVSIAAAVTAYARMEMSSILLDNSLDIMYIDTDSYKCKQRITDLSKYKYLDHSGLGALKYEETYSESLFLLPKVYGGLIKDSDKELVKIKGFKNKIEFDSLKELLFKIQELKLKQSKMYRDWLLSEIKVKTTDYTLALNENKRLIDLKTFKTKPYPFESYDPKKIVKQNSKIKNGINKIVKKLD
jgi:hypothetical protein